MSLGTWLDPCFLQYSLSKCLHLSEPLTEGDQLLERRFPSAMIITNRTTGMIADVAFVHHYLHLHGGRVGNAVSHGLRQRFIVTFDGCY